jgi:hypothetical protein
MNAITRTAFAACAALVLASLVGRAQQVPAVPALGDPRVGLKAGFRDAGEAARNMERVATVPKPEGFFDPQAPGGPPTPPEDPEDDKKTGAETTPPPPPNPAAAAAMRFLTSDLAFKDHHLFVGSFHGFNIFDIETAKAPRLTASIVCPGGQGDLSVYGRLLFMSVEQNRGRIDCGTEGNGTNDVAPERFRGVRIFDITDLRKPRQIAAVQTCRGSHTHTLVVPPGDTANVYIYVSGTGPVRSGEELAGCSKGQPDEDPSTSLYRIDVIQVPLAAPETARIVSQPRIFADATTGKIAGLWPGGTYGPGTQTSRVTNSCHDITVFAEIGLAAGACAGNGILLDTRDPAHPVRIDQAADKNFAYWHSATFNNDGTKVIFTDEWSGGLRPRCRASDPPTWGGDAIFDIVDRKLRFAGYYKMPAPQTETENCVAHNGSIVPVPGRDIMVQGWYQGGISMFDFTDSARPVEIAYFDRGPIDARQLVGGGYWCAYWYNGFIYASELARGFDVFRLKPSDQLSQNELTAATLVQASTLNVQAQSRVVWQPTPAVARAYLDQLSRSGGISTSRAAAVRSSMDRGDTSRLTAVAQQIDADAASARGVDAARLRALAATMRERADQRPASRR